MISFTWSLSGAALAAMHCYLRVPWRSIWQQLFPNMGVDSVVADQQGARFRAAIFKLRGDGVAILFVSHKPLVELHDVVESA